MNKISLKDFDEPSDVALEEIMKEVIIDVKKNYLLSNQELEKKVAEEIELAKKRNS